MDVVDEDDGVVGVAKVSECLERGLLHRAVAVLVERPTGEVVLQVRSKRDLWMPGKLTLSSTGHVKKGETYSAAARRELKEELGVSARLSFVGKMLMPKLVQGRLTEWEWVAAFRAKSGSELRPDRTELEGVLEASRQELGRLLRSRKMTDDAKILVSRYFA